VAPLEQKDSFLKKKELGQKIGGGNLYDLIPI